MACICCSCVTNTKQCGTQWLTSKDETNGHQPTSQDEHSRADEKSSQGLTRRAYTAMARQGRDKLALKGRRARTRRTVHGRQATTNSEALPRRVVKG